MTRVTLSEIARIHSGGRLGLSGKHFVESGVPAYGAAGLNGYLDTPEYQDTEAIILSSIGARCGKCFLVSGTWTSLANTQVILPDPARVDPRFLWYQLNDESRWPRSGSAQPFIKPADIKTHRVYLPSLANQRRIATVLDRANALRAKRSRVRAHLNTLSQAVFDAMFGAIEWDQRLSDLVDVQIGPFGSLLHKTDYIVGGVPVLNPMHIRAQALVPDRDFSVSEQKAEALALYRLKLGDVVLGRRGEMGRAGIAGAQHVGMLCGTGSLVLRPRVAESDFVHAVVSSPRMKDHLERNALGVTLPNLNAGIVKNSPVPNVPREAQREFAVRVRRIHEHRARVQRALAADEELFASLQSRAFRGDLG